MKDIFCILLSACKMENILNVYKELCLCVCRFNSYECLNEIRNTNYTMSVCTY